MFKTIFKMLFFSLLTGLIFIVIFQTWVEKLSDGDLGIVAALSLLAGTAIGYFLKDKYMSRKIGIPAIWFFIVLVILIIAFGIYDLIFVHHEGMEAMLPYIVLIASLIPVYMAFMIKLFMRKKDSLSI